jgi:hypothetical protein
VRKVLIRKNPDIGRKFITSGKIKKNKKIWLHLESIIFRKKKSDWPYFCSRTYTEKLNMIMNTIPSLPQPKVYFHLLIYL